MEASNLKVNKVLNKFEEGCRNKRARRKEAEKKKVAAAVLQEIVPGKTANVLFTIFAVPLAFSFPLFGFLGFILCFGRISLPRCNPPYSGTYYHFTLIKTTTLDQRPDFE